MFHSWLEVFHDVLGRGLVKQDLTNPWMTDVPSDVMAIRALHKMMLVGAVFVFLIVSVVSFICYRRIMQRQREEAMSAAYLRRKRIRQAVRAKILQAEGLKDVHSLKWYIDQRHPMVHFKSSDLDSISIESGTNQSVHIVYNLGEDGGLSNLKTVEVNLSELLSTADSDQSGPSVRRASQLRISGGSSYSTAPGQNLNTSLDTHQPERLPADFGSKPETESSALNPLESDLNHRPRLSVDRSPSFSSPVEFIDIRDSRRNSLFMNAWYNT